VSTLKRLLPPSDRGRPRLTAALVALLAALLFTAVVSFATAANGDPLAAGGAGRAAGSLGVPTDRALSLAVAASPIRTIVRSGATAGRPSLMGAQLREQRSTQLQSMFQSMLQSQTTDPVTAEVDPRVDRASCTLLGRTWTDAGCSRSVCLTGEEYAKTGANAETCRIGGRRGASYGVEVDFRQCQALHRRWIGLLNYCASDPHRAETVVLDAPQCRGPFTSYVLLSEQPGGYDECLRPSRVAELSEEADASGRDLAAVVAERSATQCRWRAGHALVDGVCRETTAPPRPAVRGNVAVIGDSITWRGTNELATLQPDWVIDGSSGRQIHELDERLDAYRAAYGEPGGIVLALGTNAKSGWSEQEFVASVARVPASTPILLVTPFRQPGSSGRPALMDSYAGWFRRLAEQRPLTCVADWRTDVTRDSQLLVDGVHPTTIGEIYWAEMIDNAWGDCLERNELSSF